MSNITISSSHGSISAGCFLICLQILSRQNTDHVAGSRSTTVHYQQFRLDCIPQLLDAARHNGSWEMRGKNDT